ncbi:MAG: DNA polymerase III subunit delta [Candidatus Hydrothermia bacterium]
MKRILDYYVKLFKTLKDPSQIKKGYVFWGKEDFLMDQAVNTICSTIDAERVVIDGSSRDFVDNVGLNIQGGLFQKKKLIVVKFIEKPKKISEILPLLLKSGEYFVLVYGELEPTEVPQGIEKIKFPPLDYESLKHWIYDKLNKMKKTIPQGDFLDIITFQMPGDLRSASNELKKIELFSLGQNVLNLEHLRVLSEYEKSSLYEIISDLLSQSKTYFRKYSKVIKELQSPVYVTTTFVNIFKNNLKTGVDKNKLKTSSSFYGSMGYFIGKQFSYSDVLRMLLLSVKFDSLVKSVTVDKNLILYEMALNFKVNAGNN